MLVFQFVVFLVRVGIKSSPNAMTMEIMGEVALTRKKITQMSAAGMEPAGSGAIRQLPDPVRDELSGESESMEPQIHDSPETSQAR
jgi:hypothetical protein